MGSNEESQEGCSSGRVHREQTNLTSLTGLTALPPALLSPAATSVDINHGATPAPLQFAYQEKVGMDDAIFYLLHWSLSHLDRGRGAVRIMFFDFPSAFNTIQPLLLRDKRTEMGVDQHLVLWVTDYVTDRPQYVRLEGCT